MSSKVTCVQAYKIVYHFLDNIYFITYDDNLGSILSGCALYSNISGQKPETMDPAIFGQWMKELKIVVGDDSITYESQVTIEQAYASMYQYFVMYCDLGAEPSIFALRDLFGENFNQFDTTKWLEKKWLQSVEFVMHREVSQENMGIFIGERTILDEQSSFKIMQIFLDNYCEQNDNQDLVELVKNSLMKQLDEKLITELHIWIVWQQALAQAMDKEDCKEINLLVAFYAMAFFLLDYFDEDKVIIFEDMALKFAIDKDSKPINFSFWCDWTSAAIKFNAQQTEIVNNLVSINTKISQDIACEIIQIWLQYKKDLIGADVVQQVLADMQGMQHAMDEIKQLQRSYLLLDNEVTILETYHIMIKLLELHGKMIPEFAVDEKGKLIDFAISLDWIRICEQVTKA